MALAYELRHLLLLQTLHLECALAPLRSARGRVSCRARVCPSSHCRGSAWHCGAVGTRAPASSTRSPSASALVPPGAFALPSVCAAPPRSRRCNRLGAGVGAVLPHALSHTQQLRTLNLSCAPCLAIAQSASGSGVGGSRTPPRRLARLLITSHSPTPLPPSPLSRSLLPLPSQLRPRCASRSNSLVDDNVAGLALKLQLLPHLHTLNLRCARGVRATGEPASARARHARGTLEWQPLRARPPCRRLDCPSSPPPAHLRCDSHNKLFDDSAAALAQVLHLGTRLQALDLSCARAMRRSRRAPCRVRGEWRRTVTHPRGPAPQSCCLIPHHRQEQCPHV